MKKYSLIRFILLAYCCFSCQQGKQKTNRYPENRYPSQFPQDSLKQSMERGGMIYTDFCMQCHLANGMGIPRTFPPLAQSNWLSEKRTESIHAVKYGQKGEIKVNGKIYDGIMAPMGLSNKEVANVMNYIMNSWGNLQDNMVTQKEVASVKK